MKKKKLIIMLGFLFISILVFIVLYNKKNTLNNMTEQEKIQKNNVSLFSSENATKKKEVIDLIKKYSDKIPNLKEYAKNNFKNKITVLELKNNFNIDITDFEKLSYKCSNEGSFIGYNDDYSKSFIVIDCKAFKFD